MNALWAKNKIGFINGTLKNLNGTKTAKLHAWMKCNSMVVSWIYNALAKELHESVAYENLSVSIYFTKLKAIWDELSIYTPGLICSYPCSCEASKDFHVERDKEKVYQFLLGLSDRFNNIRSYILSMEPLPMVTKVYAMVSQDERHQALVSHQGLTMEAAALHVAGPSKPNNSKSIKDHPKIKCDHCKKPGHSKDRCYELHGYPPGWESK
ncbi:PREDICTED: uncharacterized protein LOC109114783 [Nelumbo nucifera]|uniref:Uncharacterized protein LOC109114783 n=1 Tax=Nelumbo nucifera TaxID=4432 RepID=A0A1U8Q4I3_NELNU|nr:PREDICTED: uncharacterized protein LOC109114783 [Nelumbo nucifera]